jgi:hypothetical protein
MHPPPRHDGVRDGRFARAVLGDEDMVQPAVAQQPRRGVAPQVGVLERQILKPVFFT